MRRQLWTLSLLLLAACSGDLAMEGAAYEPGGGEYQPPAPQAGETYAHYGVNDFTDPAEDDLITFGADVDTGSYTLMRSDVMAGRRPVPAGVRVEEYLNYFDYGLEPPRDPDGVPFAVHTEAAPSPFGEDLHLLRVALKGREVAAEDRPPVNLVFLVDVSGSMSSAGKLDLVTYGLQRLITALRPDDTLGIVVYAGADGVVLEPTPVRERGVILAALQGLQAGGSTNGEAGIRTAYDLAQGAWREGGINRVILCSDGDFNVGLTGQALIDFIDSQRERGLSLSVFGFGRGNYNDRDMEQMADHGNGNYAFIDGRAEADRVMVEGLGGVLHTIAKDVKIQ
ncbi:MAG: von Willebrand factor type A domain-containing protein, partial [Myxococcales bacterium]|nr:von Willebrand factor type A domain-containing protein [Myxococcales bacterium]